MESEDVEQLERLEKRLMCIGKNGVVSLADICAMREILTVLGTKDPTQSSPSYSSPPFKFEVGQRMGYALEGNAIGLPGKVQKRERRGCCVYRINDKWFAEDVLSPIPPPPFKFVVGQEVRARDLYGVVVNRRFDGKRNVYGFGSEITHHFIEVPEDALSPDSSVPPPPRFKTGDWVRGHTAGRVGRVVMGDAHIGGYDCDVLWGIGCTTSERFRSLEPWQPRIGEWVLVSREDGGFSRPVCLSSILPEYSVPGYVIPAPLGEASQEWFA